MTSFDAVCKVVERGVGIAVIPERAARRYSKKAIDVIGLADDWATRDLKICVRQFEHLSPHAKHLIRQLRSLPA